MFDSTLFEAIETLISSVDKKSLQKSAEALSMRYRSRQNQEETFIKNKEEALAYLCMRFPATYAANNHVFSRINELSLPFSYSSFLDVGSGSGSSFFSAQSHFGAFSKVCFIEKDLNLIEIGKTLIKESKMSTTTSWVCGDFVTKEFPNNFDVVSFSYSLGEVKNYKDVLSKAIVSFNDLLVIIEPGTPAGFERILKYREFLLSKGLFLLAPCPGSFSCPMQNGKWCHFSERLSRSSLHRFLKGGTLGFEDEKLSYLVFSKKQFKEHLPRLISFPSKKTGFIEAEFCMPDGTLLHKKFLKREEDEYKKIKKAKWGDSF